MKKLLLGIFIIHTACFSSPFPETENIDPPPPAPIDDYQFFLIFVMLFSASYFFNFLFKKNKKNETAPN